MDPFGSIFTSYRFDKNEPTTYEELMCMLSMSHAATSINQLLYPLGIEEHKDLCKALLESPALSHSLRRLHLYGDLDPEVALCYARLLLATPSLESLSFSLHKIGEEGLRAILRSLLSSSPKIAHLSFEGDWTIREEEEDDDGLLDNLAPTLSCVPLFQLKSNSLTNERIRSNSAALLAEYVYANTSLLSLDISINRIGDAGLKSIAHMLGSNSSLQNLSLQYVGFSLKSTKYFGIALAQNKTLQNLNISLNPELGEKGMDLMFPHTAACTLKNLTFRNAHRIFKAFARILRHSTTLTTLNLSNNSEMKPSRVQKLFKTIANNGYLQSLNLSKCKAVEGEKVVSCILDALQINSCLVDLNISDTPLWREGQAAVIEAQLKRIKNENVTRSPQMQKTEPNCIRVFMCGLSYADKEQSQILNPFTGSK